MGRVIRRGSRRRVWRVQGSTLLRFALVVAIAAAVAAVAGDGGARAERSAAVDRLSLEKLLRERRELEQPAPPAPSSDDLRERHERLRRQRAEIEDQLPPRLRTPRPRRPELRHPPNELTGRESALAFDSAIDNPDRVSFEVPR